MSNNTHEDDDFWSRLRKKPDTPEQNSLRSATKPRKDQRQRRRHTQAQQRPSLVGQKGHRSPAAAAHAKQRPQPAPKKTPKIYTLKKRTALIAIAIVIALGLVGLGIYWLMSSGGQHDQPQSLGLSDELQQSLESAEPVEEVSFRPFYPEDYDERGITFTQQLRGDTEYVTYTDTLRGTNLTVTQQLLNEDLAQGGDDQVESLARALPVPAESVIQIDDTRVFVGVSEQNQQSLLLEKQNILIFINAEGLIDESAWVGYISSLINGAED